MTSALVSLHSQNWLKCQTGKEKNKDTTKIFKKKDPQPPNAQKEIPVGHKVPEVQQDPKVMNKNHPTLHKAVRESSPTDQVQYEAANDEAANAQDHLHAEPELLAKNRSNIRPIQVPLVDSVIGTILSFEFIFRR